LVTDGAGPSSWSGNVLIDINATLQENGYSDDQFATRIGVDLDNLLEVYTEDGTSASISKKDFDVAMSIDIIPEPASLVLIGVASSLVIFARRRFIV
jgi:hypothetical protein